VIHYPGGNGREALRELWPARVHSSTGAQMTSVTYSRTGTDGSVSEGGSYEMSIDGRPVGHIERVGRRWCLHYAGEDITLTSFAAVTALVKLYADKIAAGHPIGGTSAYDF
jgi:hypothetical protein